VAGISADAQCGIAATSLHMVPVDGLNGLLL
jgi:hypothetical protein